MSFVCSTCQDTHRMHMEDVGDVMCTFCPVPCQRCRSGGNGPYCKTTPCDCACHTAAALVEPPMGGQTRPDVATSLRAKNAELVRVLKQVREVIQPVVPAILRKYLDTAIGDDYAFAANALNAVNRVGRQIDDALFAFADDTAVKERVELVQQRDEARMAAEAQADALAEQAEDVCRLRGRLHIEQLKTAAMNRALSEVWEQVPDEDRIGRPAPDWVRGLGRRVRELTAMVATEEERTA
jgi:hypothetical protein